MNVNLTGPYGFYFAGGEGPPGAGAADGVAPRPGPPARGGPKFVVTGSPFSS